MSRCIVGLTKPDRSRYSMYHEPRSTPSVSVILPVYQEEEGVEVCLSALVRVLEDIRLDYEVIAVDDGSSDRSLAILRGLQEQYERLRVAHHLHNRGYGAALRTGVRLARGDLVVFMDADGQHVPEEIPRLLEHIPPYDLVIGYRTKNYLGPWYRNAGNRFYNWIASWLTRSEIKDLTSGFRAMRREAMLHFLSLLPTGFSASATGTLAFLKAGYNVLFIPVNVRPRSHGRSKVNLFADGWRFLLLTLRIIVFYDPLRIFGPLAGMFTIMGLISWIWGILAAGRLLVPNSTVLFCMLALLSVLEGIISGQIAAERIHYFGDEFITVYEGKPSRRIDGSSAAG